MSAPRGSADGAWQRPKIKALSTLSLGFYNGRTQSSSSVLSRAKSTKSVRAFEPVAEENVRVNPDAWHHIDGLKVAMMNIRADQTIPRQYNYSVNILLEYLKNVLSERESKDQQIAEANAEAEAAKQDLVDKTEAWNVLEADYKQEVKNLELIIAGGKRGLELVALSRSNTELRKHREEFRKTTSNLSSVVHATEEADEDDLTRQISRPVAVSNPKRRSQVFDHKRMSKPPIDKLFADFGTLTDTQLSHTIQQNDDALAGAAKDRWLRERKLNGLPAYSIPSISSSDGKAAGLGLTLYDPPLVQGSFKAPLPPPTIVEPNNSNNSDDDYKDDDGADDGQELSKILGGGYMVKPKKRTAGSRAKAFFGIGRKKGPKHPEPEDYYSDSSSSSSSSDSDGSLQGVAQALASINHLATIASPMAGVERAKTPLYKGGLAPPRNSFQRAKKTSHTNLSAFAQHFMHGAKKDSSRKSDESQLSQQSGLSDTNHDMYVVQPRVRISPERRAYSEAFLSSMNVPPSASSQGGKENMLPEMLDEPSGNFILGVPSMRQEVLVESKVGGVQRYHEPTKEMDPPDKFASRSTSILRYEYLGEREAAEGHHTPIAQLSVSGPRSEYYPDNCDDNVPSYGKSNSVRESLEDYSTKSITSSPSCTSKSMGLGMVSLGLAHGEYEEGLERPHPYADYGSATCASRANPPGRGYDRRLLKNSSAIQLDVRIDQIEEKDERIYPIGLQKVWIDPITFREVEAESRRVLWRASGHKLDGDEPISSKDDQRPETFRESIIRRQSTAQKGTSGVRTSMASVVTVLCRPRESLHGGEGFVFPPQDDHLIRGRSVRSVASRNANSGSPGRAIEEKTKSIISTHGPRESIRGNKNFLTSLRSAMMHPSSLIGEMAGGSHSSCNGSKESLGSPRLTSGESVSSIRQRLEENQAKGAREQVSKTAKNPADSRSSTDRVVSNITTPLSTGQGDQNGAKHQRFVPFRGRDTTSTQRQGGPEKHGSKEKTRVPSGPNSRKNMGQSQASGEQAQAPKSSINPAIAAARKVTNDAAQKKMTMEKKAENKK